MLLVCYILLSSCAVYFLPFFKDNSIKRIWLLIAFALKIAAGFGLIWVYTKYYPDRQTADIFKYFDDSKMIYSAFEKHQYADYVKMISGIGNDNEYFNENYYTRMNHWSRHYDFGTYNDNHTIIRLNALLIPFSGGNFYIHMIVMCFCCLCGLWALYKGFKHFFRAKEKLLFLVIFFIPSVVFWSSAVLKESILMCALGFLFFAFFNLLQRRKTVSSGIIFTLASLLILINKNYLLLAVFPAMFCYFMAGRFQIRKAALFYFSVYAAGFFFVLLISNSAYEDNLLETFSLKQRDFINVSKGGIFIQNDKYFVRVAPDKKTFLDTISKNNFRIRPGSEYMYWKNENLDDTIYAKNSNDTASYHLVWDLPLAGSTIQIKRLEPTLWSLVKTAPMALYNSLCKPSFLSAHSAMEKISAVENSVVILFLMICVWYRKENYNRNIFSMLFFISIVILLLIGYTTPVAGAIVRYKVPVLPFMLMYGLCMLDKRKLPQFFKKAVS